IADVEAQPVRLPPLVGVRLGTVLDKLAASVQGTYLVRDDHIEMTTQARFRATVWGLVEEGSIASRVRLPVVQAGIYQRPLDAALAELAEATGYSVVVDGRRCGDRARAAVTASLTNVPLDTAVQLLADQVGLEATVLDNVFYITTPANARNVRMEHRQVNLNGLEPGTPPSAAQ